MNYLDTDHAGLACAFAAPTDDHAGRFDRADWVDGPAGTPLPRDALVGIAAHLPSPCAAPGAAVTVKTVPPLVADVIDSDNMAGWRVKHRTRLVGRATTSTR